MEPPKEPGRRRLLTVGHSNHEPDAFVALLRSAGIKALIDVRSQPYSRHAPHFNRSPLTRLLAAADIEYRHEPGLGGRPDDPGMYDETGHVLYGMVAESDPFLAALSRLEVRAETTTTAIMCGEEDPTECHRRLLVGRVLEGRGWRLLHLRRDGRVQAEDELPQVGGTQEGLFEGGEFSTWRSIQSVSPRNRPRSSSGS